MLTDFLLAFAASLCIFLCMQGVKRRLLLPAVTGGNLRVAFLVEVSGAAPELENTVKALLRLRDEIRGAEIIIKDCGSDAETAAVAQHLAQMHGIKLIF